MRQIFHCRTRMFIYSFLSHFSFARYCNGSMQLTWLLLCLIHFNNLISKLFCFFFCFGSIDFHNLFHHFFVSGSVFLFVLLLVGMLMFSPHTFNFNFSIYFHMDLFTVEFQSFKLFLNLLNFMNIFFVSYLFGVRLYRLRSIVLLTLSILDAMTFLDGFVVAFSCCCCSC